MPNIILKVTNYQKHAGQQKLGVKIFVAWLVSWEWQPHLASKMVCEIIGDQSRSLLYFDCDHVFPVPQIQAMK